MWVSALRLLPLLARIFKSATPDAREHSRIQTTGGAWFVNPQSPYRTTFCHVQPMASVAVQNGMFFSCLRRRKRSESLATVLKHLPSGSHTPLGNPHLLQEALCDM
jgi:hypothetical protein